jgi:hypothetical protein
MCTHILCKVYLSFNSSRTGGDFCHQARHTKIAQKIKFVEIYWRDHSLESSWVAPSDGTISFPIHPFSGEMHFLNLS